MVIAVDVEEAVVRLERETVVGTTASRSTRPSAHAHLPCTPAVQGQGSEPMPHGEKRKKRMQTGRAEINLSLEIMKLFMQKIPKNQ